MWDRILTAVSPEQTIWWVRHGPTHARSMVGWSDLPADLSDTEALVRLEASLPRDVPVVSSDLCRAVMTADAIVGPRPRLAAEPDLREMHFGAWELRSHRDIELEDPDRIRAFWERPGEVRPPGGESWNDLSARVSRSVAGLLSVHGSVIAVAHFGVILSELQRVLGWTGEAAFAQRIEPLSLTRITYAPAPRAGPINHRS